MTKVTFCGILVYAIFVFWAIILVPDKTETREPIKFSKDLDDSLISKKQNGWLNQNGQRMADWSGAQGQKL